MSLAYYTNEQGEKIAYVHSPATPGGEGLPAVMFLGGFKSDMAGTKALFLEEQCRERGQEYVRFDYTGHGESDGTFAEGTIGYWKNNARDILDHIVSRDVILVGSSMGGWIGLLLLLERPARIKAMVGIAAAPDFTKEIWSERLNDAQRATMEREGRVEIPNDYSDEPYIFTKALIEDGAQHCLLDRLHKISAPLVLLQGKQDEDVPWEKAIKIKEMFQGPDNQVIFIDDGDHRLSREEDLALLNAQVERLSGL